jgi:hypothetical protein
VKAVFSARFREDLAREEARYQGISARLASAFRERIAGQTREIIRWQGGDHTGPHGFPCRRSKPFPFFIYYLVRGETIYFLGLVHERRHPDFLKEQMGLRGTPPSAG